MRQSVCQCSDGQRSPAEERASQHLLVDLRRLVVGPGQMDRLHGSCAAVQDLRTQKAEDRQQNTDRLRVPELRAQLGDKVGKRKDLGGGPFLWGEENTRTSVVYRKMTVSQIV